MKQLFTFFKNEKMNKSHKNDKKDIILLSTAWSSPAENGVGPSGCRGMWEGGEERGEKDKA